MVRGDVPRAGNKSKKGTEARNDRENTDETTKYRQRPEQNTTYENRTDKPINTRR